MGETVLTAEGIVVGEAQNKLCGISLVLMFDLVLDEEFSSADYILNNLLLLLIGMR